MYSNLNYRMRMLIPKSIYAQVTYYIKCKKFLNLNNPQTFDEKIWWLKYHYFNPLMTICSDKWKVRDYVKACGLQDILNDCYGCYSSLDEIDIDVIPTDDFYLKINNTSGGNILCHKSVFNIDNIRSKFNLLLKDNFYWHGREYNYRYINPCIIAEKVLKPDDDWGLLDYKFLCFEGEPRLLFLDIGVANKDGSHAEDYYRNIYDMEFNVIDNIRETRDSYRPKDIKKPEKWDYMLDCCRKLSKPFPHCRIDLYYVGGSVIFGEITFFHGSGYNDFSPREADLMVGSWIPLDSSYPLKYSKKDVLKLTEMYSE